MRHLYHFNWFLDTTVAATVIDDLQKRDLDTEEIILLTCDGALGSCWSNPCFDPRLCSSCRFWKQGSLEGIESRIQRVTIEDLLEQADTLAAGAAGLMTYETLEDIRNIEFKGARVGWASLSVFISKTSDTDPVLDDRFRTVFDPILRSAIRLTEAADTLIREWQPQLITIFNGRTADTRPLLDLARRYQIELRGLENETEAPNRYRVRIFPNCTPQDPAFARRETLEVWTKSARSDEEKKAIAREFFTGRRGGKGTRDVRSYIDAQVSGFLPKDWTSQRRNIVMYNSSDNEFAGVPEFVEGNLFSTQLEGIEFILQNLPKDNSWITLRVHPNLTAVPYAYHQELYRLPERYDRITVVPADSPVSSYALMDAADLVVVFHSSTGAEAAYWGKPVVAISKTSYSGLDVAYEPSTRTELLEMLATELPAKPPLSAEQWAYGLMALEEYSAEVGLKRRFFSFGGKSIIVSHDHLTLMGSTILFRVVSYFRYILPIRIRPAQDLSTDYRGPKRGC